MAEHPKRKPLGQILIRQGRLREPELHEALETQRHNRKPLGQILVESGAVSVDDLSHAITLQWEYFAPLLRLARYLKKLTRIARLLFSLTRQVQSKKNHPTIFTLLQSLEGPIFYKGQRVGKDEKVFKVYKFRTLKQGAEEEIGQRLLTPKG